MEMEEILENKIDEKASKNVDLLDERSIVATIGIFNEE